jgi:hypothetical protein
MRESRNGVQRDVPTSFDLGHVAWCASHFFGEFCLSESLVSPQVSHALSDASFEPFRVESPPSHERPSRVPLV